MSLLRLSMQIENIPINLVTWILQKVTYKR